jgi:UDP-glucose 4-epimerase
VRNQITALFEKPVVLGLCGVSTPFVFVWDGDVVGCIEEGIRGDKAGVYNLAGDGAVTLREIAARLDKPYVELPEGLITTALAALHRLGRSQYGPEQVGFLKHRPVLLNRRLKQEFGYRPRYTSREVFELYQGARG